MANSSRRYIDKSGNMFIPMNLEGGTWDEHFITTGKLFWIVAMVGMFFAIIFWLSEKVADASSWLFFMGLYVFIAQYILRYIIFEEKFYYRMYKIMKTSEVTTPAIFWDVVSMRDGPDGVIINYSDAKIAVVLKLERDTITGKPADFKEDHYDAISEFYKELNVARYNIVQMNLMEPAGNDPRLGEMDKLINKAQNENIKKLMEYQVGYLKNITQSTLYESEYLLIYTRELNKTETIFNEVAECAYCLRDGAFTGFRFLNVRDVVELERENFGVQYFNHSEATMDMFKQRGMKARKPFVLKTVYFEDGDYRRVKKNEITKIENMTSEMNRGNLDTRGLTLRGTVFVGKEKEKDSRKSIGFSGLSDMADIGIEEELAEVTSLKGFDIAGEKFIFGDYGDDNIDI